MTLAQGDIVQGAPALTLEQVAAALADLPQWQLDPDGPAIAREWRLRNFAQAVQLANLVAWVAEAGNHHPDIGLGWGYLRVSLSTHSAQGVTLNDLVMAARIEAAIAAGQGAAT